MTRRPWNFCNRNSLIITVTGVDWTGAGVHRVLDENIRRRRRSLSSQAQVASMPGSIIQFLITLHYITLNI